MPGDYIGLLHSGVKNAVQDQVAALKGKLGGIDLDDKYANNHPDDLESIAEDFVDDGNCKVIIAGGGTLAAVVAKQVTEWQKDNPQDRKPVVFTAVQNPVALGLVDSLASPN